MWTRIFPRFRWMLTGFTRCWSTFPHNAIDAVEPLKGLIHVVCRYEAEERQIVIEVIDNGAGIPPNLMKHLFELFHSTKGNRGTGIGLAVTKKIIEEHEGSISVRGAPGEGTTFRFDSRRITKHRRSIAYPWTRPSLSSECCSEMINKDTELFFPVLGLETSSNTSPDFR